MKLAVHVRARRGTVQAFCPDLPGCSAVAPSEAEALETLRHRVSQYFAQTQKSVAPGTRIVEVEV